MLLRISLIVAILAGLGAGGIGYYEWSTQIPALKQQRDDEKDAKNLALTQLAGTNRILVATQAKLAETQQELADTKSERDKAVARAEAQSKRADELSTKLAKAVSERDDAQNQLASYKATDLTPEQIIKLNKNLKDAQSEIEAIKLANTLLQRKLVRTESRLALYEDKDLTIKLRPDLKGKILVVDPKWDFVVLNIGEDQGALQDAELLVSREGKLVAKVVIRSVEKDRCIANILPGWRIGDPIEGDEVTPAHPAPAS
jgi:hypothetical protein